MCPINEFYTWPPQAGQFTHQRTGSFSIQTCDTSKTEGSNSLWILKQKP
jgi:hypothetical protein